MKKTTCRPCFSCGSEAAWWTEKNCERCIKSSRLKADKSGYTQSRCKIFDEIGEQWLGYGNEPVSLRTYDATQRTVCPYLQTKRKQYKRFKEDKNQLNLEL